jgi:hypothetical protein
MKHFNYRFHHKGSVEVFPKISFLAIAAFPQKTTSSSLVNARESSLDLGQLSKSIAANSFARKRISWYLAGCVSEGA